MKVLLPNTHHTFNKAAHREKNNWTLQLMEWIKRNEPDWEYNRLGIAATGIFIQVTIAAAMVAVLGLTRVNVWVASPGILLTFLANSVAYGQAPMKWVLGFFIASVTVNILLIIFFLIQAFLW